MMDPKELMAEAAVLEPQLQNWRRTLHRHPEVGFDLPQTRALVKQALTEMGYTPQDCGKAGILVLAGGKKPGKTILLRGDMDALPIQEESGVDFASEVPGRMHGCGHDMHTAMMLGAAKLLKAHEEELEGTVKLEFQPAEEIFQGSPDMIANGPKFSTCSYVISEIVSLKIFIYSPTVSLLLRIYSDNICQCFIAVNQIISYCKALLLPK